MPIYAYRCTACGHEKDVLQKMRDAALTNCPACHAESFAKQLTAPGFQLKGSGWYATDFKGGNTVAPVKAPAESTSAKEGTSTKESSSTAESTPATPCGGGCACH